MDLVHRRLVALSSTVDTVATMIPLQQLPKGSYVVDIDQLKRQLTLDEKRHVIQGHKDDAHKKEDRILPRFHLYFTIVRLVALSRAAYWITILYAFGLFAGCHVTAAGELASAHEKYERERNGTDAAQPMLSSLGICAEVDVETIQEGLKGFETFTLFLLISYFTTVTSRVWNMYCCTVAAMGRINDIVCLSRGCYEASQLQDTDGRLFLIDIHRFCSLSWVACFVGVTEAYTVDNLFRPFCRAHTIPGAPHLDLGLLSKKEFVELQNVIYLNKGGNGLRFFIKCALRSAAIAEKRGVLSEQSYNVLINKIILLRAKIGTLFDYRMMPINAAYKILVNFSTYSYLLVFVTLKVLTIFQHGSGMTIVILGFLTILFLMFMFIGLLTLAHELEFPFSKDGLFDHRVTNLVHGIAQSSAKILFESPCIGTTMKDIDDQARGQRLQSFEIQLRKSATKIKSGPRHTGGLVSCTQRSLRGYRLVDGNGQCTQHHSSRRMLVEDARTKENVVVEF